MSLQCSPGPLCPHRAQTCLPCSCLQTLPVPAQPRRARSGRLRCLRRASLGVLERACPAGAKRAVGAGVRPLQMAGAADPGTREPRHCHPPRGGVPLPGATAGSRGQEGAIPTQNRPGGRVCPCALWPKLPRDGQSTQSSWVVDWSRVPTAPMARQQWKLAKNVVLGSTRLGTAGPGLQGKFPPQGKLRHRKIYLQSSSSSAPVTERGHFFSHGKNN